VDIACFRGYFRFGLDSIGMTLLSYFLALRPFLTAMRRLVEASV
jgi:hypothetical protein